MQIRLAFGRWEILTAEVTFILMYSFARIASCFALLTTTLVFGRKAASFSYDRHTCPPHIMYCTWKLEACGVGGNQTRSETQSRVVDSDGYLQH